MTKRKGKTQVRVDQIWKDGYGQTWWIKRRKPAKYGPGTGGWWVIDYCGDDEEQLLPDEDFAHMTLVRERA